MPVKYVDKEKEGRKSQMRKGSKLLELPRKFSEAALQRCSYE